MYNNGVSHKVEQGDLDGIATILKWHFVCGKRQNKPASGNQTYRPHRS